MNDDYSQPDFFRFGTDSISLVREVLARTRFKNEKCTILELGAGSGVITCELSHQLNFTQATLVEAQREWQIYLDSNLKKFLKAQNASVAWETVGEFNPNGELKFDLIVCNPPYYQLEEGRPSPIPQRNIAHRFVLESWEEWLKCIKRSLASEGEAWFLQREGSESVVKKIDNA